MPQNLMTQMPYTASQEIIDQYLVRQSKYVYVRSLADDLESVEYQPGSTLRFWYNNEMNGFEPHWHTACEIIVPTEGNYLATVSGQTYELTPGDIFLIPSGEPHSLKAPSRGGRFFLLFEFDQILAIKGSSYLASCMAQPLLINRSTCPSVYTEEANIICQICRDYLHDDSLRDISIYSKLADLLFELRKIPAVHGGPLHCEPVVPFQPAQLCGKIRRGVHLSGPAFRRGSDPGGRGRRGRLLQIPLFQNLQAALRLQFL